MQQTSPSFLPAIGFIVLTVGIAFLCVYGVSVT